jgi:S1-C subfamily serine protease
MSSIRSNTLNRVTVLIALITIILAVGFRLTPSESEEIVKVSQAMMSIAPRTSSEQQTIDVYKRANKSVVNVSTRAAVRDVFGPTSQEGSGSGVIIDAANAYVISNFHVIEGAQQLAVTLANGQSYGVKVIGFDPDNDLALLQIQDPPRDLGSIEFGDSQGVEVGQQVLAIGNPFGLNRTLTTGIISSVGRTIRAESGRLIQDVIQTDAAINPGNSGGPLLDSLGRLVGLNTAIVSRTGENSGIGFAIPVNLIKTSLPELVKYGRVRRPKIGVIVEDTEFGAPVIDYVQPDSPAAEAGLNGARRQVQLGVFTGMVRDFAQADFVLAVNGKAINTKAEMFDAIAGTEQKGALELVVKRGLGKDKPRKVTVNPVLG